jgi:hypothetical protein
LMALDLVYKGEADASLGTVFGSVSPDRDGMPRQRSSGLESSTQPPPK